jgi:hypothetical protein
MMIDRLLALIVDESRWLTASMGCALLAVAVLLHRHRHAGLPVRSRVLAAMNLFFGVTIGTMALGHLLAVTAKRATGTLEGPVLALYAIGIALAVPSWWLIGRTPRVLASGDDARRATVSLNAWLTLTLLALGSTTCHSRFPASSTSGIPFSRAGWRAGRPRTHTCPCLAPRPRV